MMTRDVSDLGYAAGCEGAPPPLHVHDTQSARAAWYPLPRIRLAPQPPGPIMVKNPGAMRSELGGVGDDPTDPAAQTIPRVRTDGMIGRLNWGGPG
jgi:hypothetical protein